MGQHMPMARLVLLHSLRSLGHFRANKGAAPTNSRRRCRGGYARRTTGLYTSPPVTASGTRATTSAMTGTMMQTQPWRNFRRVAGKTKNQPVGEKSVYLCGKGSGAKDDLALALSRALLALFPIPKPPYCGRTVALQCISQHPRITASNLTTTSPTSETRGHAHWSEISWRAWHDLDWGNTRLPV